MNETVTLIATTWAPPGEVGDSRGRSARKAIFSWFANLRYDGLLALHIADDGSNHHEYRVGADFLPAAVAPWPITFSRQERGGVGASLNAGLAAAFKVSPLVLYAVDDWILTQPFDLTIWAKLLLEWEGVGMVRLGPPHPGLTGEVLHTNWDWVLRLHRHNFAFAHRPALYHKRFFEAYGPFDEGCSALECERLYNDRFCAAADGPGIVLALPSPWEHVGEAEVGDVEP